MIAASPVSDFIQALRNAVAEDNFVKMSLGHYVGADDTLKSIHIRRIVIKRVDHLSFTFRHKTRDLVQNYPVMGAIYKIEGLLAADFQQAGLWTTAQDYNLELTRKGQWRLQKKAATQTEKPSASHDQEKNRLVQVDGRQYLRDLKITDAQDRVINAAQDKFRQIDKYVEILSALLRDLPQGSAGRIVDMGSGKGYLTFALYDYMTSQMGLNPHVTGVEYRADMVALCNDIAKKSGFDGLNFVQGAIDDYDATGVNVLIALHACDTATDDAIAKGVEAGADLIVVAPCCHKQIRRAMEAGKADNDLDFLTRYGTFMERQAEMVTDGLRAKILNYHGYRTKVFEFISDAHTPKNVLIVGTRDKKMTVRDGAVLKEIEGAKKYFGIDRHYLEKII